MFKVVKTIREYGSQNGRIVGLILDKPYLGSYRHENGLLKLLADQGALWSDVPTATLLPPTRPVKVHIFLNNHGHWVAETEPDETRRNNLLLLPIEGQQYSPYAMY